MNPPKNDSFPLVRFRKGSEKKSSGWQPADSYGVIKKLAGTPYYFGRELHKSLGIPIGIKVYGVGGTSLWLWTPESLHEQAELAPLKATMLERIEIFKKRLKENPDLSGKNMMPKPARGFAPQPSWLSGVARGKKKFGMLDPSSWLPTTPCTGIVFWQGESDQGLGESYEHLFSAMIRHWRSQSDREWPFIFYSTTELSRGPQRDSTDRPPRHYRRTRCPTPRRR